MTICIEGPTGAGKSTLATLLAAVWEENHRLCPTVDHFIGSFPICEDKSGIGVNFSWYLEGEIAANSFMQQSGGKWIQDRNWISQMTFLYAIEKTIGIDLIGLKTQITQNIDSENLSFPSSFVFLHCPPEFTQQRRSKRETTEWGDVPPWIEPSIRHIFRDARYRAYERLSNDVFPDSIIVSARNLGANAHIPEVLRHPPKVQNPYAYRRNLEKWIRL